MDASDGHTKPGNGQAESHPTSLPSTVAAPTGAPVGASPVAGEKPAGAPVERADKGKFKKGVSGNPKGRPPGTPNLNAELIKAIKKFRLGDKSYLDALLMRSIQEPELAKKILDKILVDATPKGPLIDASEHTTYETFVTQLLEKRAAANVRPGLEDLEG